MKTAQKGQVTVFLGLVMMCVFALFAVLLESARMAGARWYLDVASSSAMDSVFSQYHRQLWDSYRLLFAEYEEDSELADDFSGFLEPYLEVDNWYPISREKVDVEEVLRAVDGQGLYLEQEILEYMKYGVWNMDFQADTATELWNSAREAAAVAATAGSYRGNAKEALALEHALEKISKNLQQQRAKQQEAYSRLQEWNGPGFRRAASALIREMNRMPQLVEQYRICAEKLSQNLEKSRLKYAAGMGDCRPKTQRLLEQEIREYESYISEDGARRQEVEALESSSQENAAVMEELIRDAEEVEDIIASWEDDENGDGPDESALWAPIRHRLNQVKIAELSFAHGVKDKEKEGWLKQVEALYQGGLLEFLVPENIPVSDRRISSEDLPSAMGEADGSRQIDFLDHLLVNEYCGKFFGNFRSGTGDEESEIAENRSAEQEKLPTGLQYEIEYMIGGKLSDRENLSSAIHRLLAIREGLNFIHILSDSEKRSQARTLAATVTGAAAATPLLLVTTFFIMSVWALGESLADIRCLLDGGKIPLIKSAEDWQMGLEQLLELGKTKRLEDNERSQGLSWLSWMKILLFMDNIVQQEYRVMDLIQTNLRQLQDGFRMRNGVYQAKLQGSFYGKHVFFSLSFVENLTGEEDHVYPMKVVVERNYS